MKKIYHSWKNVEGICLDLAKQINNSKWQPDYIVGITRGGVIPAVLLSHYLEVPMNSLAVSLRDGGEPESNLWMAEDAFGYHRTDLPEPAGSNPSLRKNILIVDDINDTGATFNWIIKDWTSGCLPNDPAWTDIWNHNVKFAVLVDNLSSNCERAMDYVGIEINKAEEDCWIVFPWEEFWKNDN